MLRWDHRPERRSRSWALSIAIQRDEVADVVAGNPWLRPRIREAMEGAYRRARLEAADGAGPKLRTLPERCPYAPDEVLSRPFEWPEE